MAWIVFFALVILAPIALLVWRRRDAGPGEEGTDPLGNHDIARNGGPTPHAGGPGGGTDGWGGGI